MTLDRIDFVLAVLGIAAAPGFAVAQAWPTKPVRVIVTFAPGGSSDVVARLISGPLQQKLGQTVIVDNKPGAGGTIGAAEAARAGRRLYVFTLEQRADFDFAIHARQIAIRSGEEFQSHLLYRFGGECIRAASFGACKEH